MKLFSRIRTKEETLMSQVFKIAGLGFLLITLIGLGTYFSLDSTEIGRQLKNGGTGTAYQFSNAGGMSLLSKLSLISMVLIIGSGIMQFIWIFRIQRASKAFIYTVYTAYIIGQGIGFGYLFLTFQASELFLIFGTVGILFGSMSFSGYIAKDLSWLGKNLWMGAITSMFLGFLLIILTSTGVLSLGKFGIGTILFDILYLIGLVITLGYIMYTTWRVKQLSDYDKAFGLDQDMRFRLIAFFAFRLMSDAVALVWYAARFVARLRN